MWLSQWTDGGRHRCWGRTVRDPAAQTGTRSHVVSSYAVNGYAGSSGILFLHRTTQTLTCFPFLEGKSQAKGPHLDPRVGPDCPHGVHTTPRPGSAKLPSQEPIPLLCPSEASRIHYHTNVGPGSSRPGRFVCAGASQGAGGGAQPLQQEARGAPVQMGLGPLFCAPGRLLWEAANLPLSR